MPHPFLDLAVPHSEIHGRQPFPSLIATTSQYQLQSINCSPTFLNTVSLSKSNDFHLNLGQFLSRVVRTKSFFFYSPFWLGKMWIETNLAFNSFMLYFFFGDKFWNLFFSSFSVSVVVVVICHFIFSWLCECFIWLTQIWWNGIVNYIISCWLWKYIYRLLSGVYIVEIRCYDSVIDS